MYASAIHGKYYYVLRCVGRSKYMYFNGASADLPVESVAYSPITSAFYHRIFWLF